jgi:uncharacterized protein
MNRLAASSSPYLRSHADNPVDWFAWGEEAFAEARRRDVPVLVSIGYSTCHWCHVMARESFSDPELAGYLNANLVAIKVDREEYPDVDASFLAAAGAFTPNLGWPLTVFVTPDGGPFFAGTYWPPEALGGQPAFRTVLGAVVEAWTNNRDAVLTSARDIQSVLSRAAIASPAPLPTDLSAVVATLAALEDPQFGGFGTAPKFPVAPILGFLVGQDPVLAQRLLAATRGLQDLDGGFFRYATRQDWSEPHFERMLYDNALLLSSYARIGDADTARGIAEFLLGTLRLPSGGFACAQDSESAVDGVRHEGAYFALSLAQRAAQPRPALDEKVLTGWNGLAIEALALAGRLLDEPSWVAGAVDAAEYVLGQHAWPLIRSSIDGGASQAPATLEDYGMLANGLIELSLATAEPHYAVVARDLVDACGPDLVVPTGPEPLLVSLGLALESDPSDGAYPSGLSAIARAAGRLWLLDGNREYRDRAARAMHAVVPLALASPTAFGAALTVMDELVHVPEQVVVVADEPSELVDAARHRDGLAIAVTSAQAAAFSAAGFELFDGRTAIDGRPTAYACREFVCALPVFDSRDLRR